MKSVNNNSQPPIICSIATPSHFHLAICMADSFLEHHQDGKIFILQVGGTEKFSSPHRPQITVLTTEELNLSHYEKMRQQYNDFELCNSLKPFLLQYIFDRTDYEKICYLDSDLLVYGNLESEIWHKLDEYSVVLTPHIIKIPEANAYWRDLAIIQRGVFNGGFVGLRRDEKALDFLRWWGQRLINGGFYQLSEGLNCDQGWLDLATNFDINLYINRHPGINAAFWNLYERKIEIKENRISIDDQALLLFHFSGYSPDNLDLLSKNSFNVTFENHPEVRPIFDRYRERLLAVRTELNNTTFIKNEPAKADFSDNRQFKFPVSVIIPCHNAAPFIHQAITSVLEQTLTPIEIIVIDDGSTDETSDILTGFGNLIKVVRQEKTGVSAARNKGIEIARGEFIAFLDADDYFTAPDKLEEQLKIVRQTGSDVIQCGWSIVNETGEKQADIIDWNLAPQLNLEGWLSITSVFPGALLIRRSALMTVGGFDTGLTHFEDSDLMLRLLSAGYKAEWLKKPAVAYRHHENNATKNLAKSAADAAKMWDKFFSQKNLSSKIKRAENSLRYFVYSYLAFKCAHAGDLRLMKELLLQSRPYAKYKAGGELFFWLDYFKKLSIKFNGGNFDFLSLINSAEWQELTNLLTGFKRNSVTEIKEDKTEDIFLNDHRKTDSVNDISVPQTERNADDFESYHPKINLGASFNQPMGNHRSGWKFALNCLKPLHSENGFHLEGAIENRFAEADFQSKEIYERGWIGFFHHPPEMPRFYEEKRVPEIVLQTEPMREALKNCFGVFCFSEIHRKWLADRIKVPVARIYHPTETPENKFTPEKFNENPVKRIVQIGHWLRKVNSIYFLPTWLRKTIIHQDFPHVKEYFSIEKAHYGFEIDENAAEKLPFLNDEEYDRLLSENIVYLDLYAASVNNAIIECIVRNTPVLVNPLPAVKEYLGEDYPFYYHSRIEAAQKLQNSQLIEETYQYLLNHPIKSKLTADYFMKSIAESEIYKLLPKPKESGVIALASGSGLQSKTQ